VLSSPTKVIGIVDVKTWIRDVVTTVNRGMLGHTWEELEFRLDAVFATHGAHIQMH